jgi:mannose/fructose/N-acetylgalactosamine-specific phosphotransferase system component IID
VGYEEKNMISDDTKSTLNQLMTMLLGLVLVPAVFLLVIKWMVWLWLFLGLGPNC